MMSVRVLGDRVLVQLPQASSEVTTTSGLVLVRDPDLKASTRGIVVQIGEKHRQVDLDDVRSAVHSHFLDKAARQGELAELAVLSNAAKGYAAARISRSYKLIADDVDRVLMDMAPAPFDVAVGDCVLFSASSGEQVHLGGGDYVILHEPDIIAVVEPLKEQEVA